MTEHPYRDRDYRPLSPGEVRVAKDPKLDDEEFKAAVQHVNRRLVLQAPLDDEWWISIAEFSDIVKSRLMVQYANCGWWAAIKPKLGSPPGVSDFLVLQERPA